MIRSLSLLLPRTVAAQGGIARASLSLSRPSMFYAPAEIVSVSAKNFFSMAPPVRSYATQPGEKVDEKKSEKEEEEEEEEEAEGEEEEEVEETPEAKVVEPPAPGSTPVNSEVVTGQAATHSFQTETQKILHIVAQSLYTEREVFVRELISNASDAMEKVRHLQLTGGSLEDPNTPLEISIFTDDKNSTLTIQDTGIGMNKDELVQNLGRIGHSGSLEFLKNLGENPDKASIIGQFGVGFYSTFMVGKNIKVFSKSAKPGSAGYLWESDGSGSYSVAEAQGVQRGTKIIISLKETASEFANKRNLENVIKKYSNFVGFPIKVNGERVNTVRALWTVPKGNITEEEHKEFYQFIGRAYDTPAFRLQYSTDSPISIRALFYFPSQTMEKYGMGRTEQGVNLFSRKVLIQAKAKGILPDWLRFVRGVVDSEDIPLNISREHMQDSSLVQKLNSVLTKRILRFLEDESKNNTELYLKWYTEFGTFLKEGVCSDFKWKEDISKLLRFESSNQPAGKTTSLSEYVSRMKPDQKEIYYLTVPAREHALNSPYYEGFKHHNYEVLFLYTNMDDFVMTNLSEFNGKKIVGAESAHLDTDIETKSAGEGLAEKQVDELCAWIRDCFPNRLTIVRETKRLINAPAIIVEHESSSYRRMMKFIDPQRLPELPKQQMEVNGKHPVVKKLYEIRAKHPVLAKEIAAQIVDNAFVVAGLIDDARAMVPRLNRILEAAMELNHDIVVKEEKPAEKDAKKEEKKAEKKDSKDEI